MRLHSVLSLLCSLAAVGVGAADLTLMNTPAQVYFSPHGGCTGALVAVIDAAHSEILVQSYSFSSKPVENALQRAHDRGVVVKVILDKSQRTERYSGLNFLVNAGIPVWVDSVHPIAHNKLVLADRQTLVTGSFNHSRSAELNAENLLVLQNRDLTAMYVANWEAHRQHSTPVESKR